MKKLFKLLSLSICIAIVGGLSIGCSKKSSEEINFLNYGENIDKETVKEFEKQYGIKVNIETLMIWKQCIKRLVAEE